MNNIGLYLAEKNLWQLSTFLKETIRHAKETIIASVT
jgi:hypothetical protein